MVRKVLSGILVFTLLFTFLPLSVIADGSSANGQDSSININFSDLSLLDFWSLGVAVLILLLWGILALFKHRFRAWVVPTFCILFFVANVGTFLYFNSDIFGSNESDDSLQIEAETEGEGADDPDGIVFNTDDFDVFSDNVFFIDDSVEVLSGTVLSDEPITEMTIEISVGELLFFEDIVDAALDWVYHAPPLLPIVNTVKVTATLESGEEKQGILMLLSAYGQHDDPIELDEGDADGDGLLNWQEIAIGTDPLNPDTDGDGLTDYEEIYITLTNPLVYDSHMPGVSDGDADIDGDGISNIDEIHQFHTDPLNSDTDGDFLSDYEEIFIYGTDPLNPDTDGDGAYDGMEIANGFDPLSYDDSFVQTVIMDSPSEMLPVTAAVTTELDGEQLGTLSIESVGPAENILLTPSVPGYMGSAYTFNIEGYFDSAEITFLYDSSLGEVGSDFLPRIYYIDEMTGDFNELPDQRVEGGRITATVNYFTTYILLNSIEFNAVWDTDIRSPTSDGVVQERNVDVVFVIDESRSMEGMRRWEADNNDPDRVRVSAARQFTEALGYGDRAAVVGFAPNARTLLGLYSDMETVRDHIDMIRGDIGGTALYSGIEEGLDILWETGRIESEKVIIALTDGEDSPAVDIEIYLPLINRANRENVTIYTVGLGANIDERMLVRLSTATGGRYFHATDAIAVYEGFDFIRSDLIDYTIDSNNDGIPDYFSRLIYEGRLRLQNGSAELIGTDFDANPDIDGDGLLNGQEVVIVERNGRIFLQMLSHPLLRDSDFDGINDNIDELPLVPNFFNDDDVDTLMRNAAFEYSVFAAAYDPHAGNLLWDGFVAFLSATNVQQNFTIKMAQFFGSHISEEYMGFLRTLELRRIEINRTLTNVGNIANEAVESINQGGDATQLISNAGTRIHSLLNELSNAVVQSRHSGTEAFRQIAIRNHGESLLLDLYSGGMMLYDLWDAAQLMDQLSMNAFEAGFDALGGFVTILNAGLDAYALHMDNQQLWDITNAIMNDVATARAFSQNVDVLTELIRTAPRIQTRRAAQFILDALNEEVAELRRQQLDNITLQGGRIAVDLVLGIGGMFFPPLAVISAGMAVLNVADFLFGWSAGMETRAELLCIYDITMASNRIIGRGFHSDEASLHRHLTNLVNLRIIGETLFRRYSSNSARNNAASRNIIAVRNLASTMGLVVF